MSIRTAATAAATLALAPIVVLSVAPAAADAATPYRYTVAYSVTGHEDGSGTLHRDTWLVKGNDRVRVQQRHTYKITEGVLPWDCQTMGNKVCGPTAPADVRGPQSRTFVLAKRGGTPYSEAVTVRTHPAGVKITQVRKATDVDAEGEVIR